MKKHSSIPFLTLISIMALLATSALSLANCPIAPVKTSPLVTVKIDQDKKTGVYSYAYTVANQLSAPLSIDDFTLQIDERPLEILKPEKWTGRFLDADSTRPTNASWGTITREIKPGSSETGFIIKSRRPPGLVKYFVEGRTGVPVSTPVNGDPEAFPDCPGFFFDKPRFESMTTGMIEGPAALNQISAKIKIKKGKDKDDRKQERKDFRPYQETGLITVVLKGSKELDVSQVDIPSLHFGMGKAPVVWSEFRPGDDDDDRDDDHEARSAKKLWLQFDLDKVGIECDRDRVLFLEGKTKDAKSILGGAEIKAKDCEKTPSNPQRKKELEERRKAYHRDEE